MSLKQERCLLCHTNNDIWMLNMVSLQELVFKTNNKKLTSNKPTSYEKENSKCQAEKQNL